MKNQTNEEMFKRYQELQDEQSGYLKTMHERMPLYKGNVKKYEKDVIYKEASYKFVLAGIEMRDIKDKYFVKAFEKWKNKKQ